MRYIVTMLCVCMMLVGGMVQRAFAEQISIAGDTLLDISLRDADLGETLTALFATTNGKYSMVLHQGVVGRIGRLQLSQVTFAKALDAILGNDFTFQLENNLYNIYGPQTGAGTLAPAAVTPPGTATQAPPSPMLLAQAGSADPFSSFSPSTSTPSTTATKTTGGSGFSGGSIGSITSGASSASESSAIRLIKIYNCDVGLLSQYLGGSSIDLSGLLNNTSKGGGGGSSHTFTPVNSGGSTAAAPATAATPVATPAAPAVTVTPTVKH